MSWKTRGETIGRWEWTADDDLHLLLLAGDELRELHTSEQGTVTVHVYVEPADPLDEVRPLDGVQHAQTYVATEHPPLDAAQEEWFGWLNDEGYLP